MPEPTAVADIITAKRKESNDKTSHQSEHASDSGADAPQKKKRGRPRKSEGTVKKPLQGVSVPKSEDEKVAEAARMATAELTVNMIEQSGAVIAGNTAKMADIEKQNMIAVYNKYFESKGLKDIPIGLVLVLTTGQYYARVLTSEPAQPKVKGFARWIADKWGKFRKRKNTDARSDHRNDSERKDNASEENSEKLQG